MGKETATDHRTSIGLAGGFHHTAGLATDHGDYETGHVTVYTDAGAIMVSSEDADALRTLAGLLDDAADRLEELRGHKTPVFHVCPRCSPVPA